MIRTFIETEIFKSLIDQESDKKIILSIMTTYQWLYNQLQTAKFSMHRLKKMFGFKTERMSSIKKNNSQDLPEQDRALQAPLSPDKTEPTPKKS
jgi:IS30 family transposase